MAGWWRALSRAAQRYPWPTNVMLYGALFSAGDALQQRLRGGPADWRQTRCVATVAVAFHANFSYVWLRLLERALPGRTPRAILAKVLCDQAVAAPVAVSAFYTGMSILQGKDDIFLDLKQKFWNTYKLIPEVLPMASTDMWSLQCTLSRPGPFGPWLALSWLLCGISCGSLTASTMCSHQHPAGAEDLEMNLNSCVAEVHHLEQDTCL